MSNHENRPHKTGNNVELHKKGKYVLIKCANYKLKFVRWKCPNQLFLSKDQGTYQKVIYKIQNETVFKQNFLKI